jgi:uncharacterized protein
VEPPLITLDSSAIYSLIDRRERSHTEVTETLAALPGPYLVPAGILAETAYLLQERLGSAAIAGFLDDLAERRFVLDCGEEDFPRIRALVVRHDDLPLGFSDAAVIACAERSGGRVLTLDVRDFGVVAREGSISILPEPH